MGYQRAIEAPFHRQWDSDSRAPSPDPGSAPYNCGPTSVVNIVHAYRGTHYSIYETRRLGTYDPYRGTSVGEQKEMLSRRGVPCTFTQLSMAQIKAYGAQGRHPVLLGLNMAAVPYDIAGHTFRGWHAVVALQNTSRNGESGVLVRDPNFNITFRIDPTDGKRFYPDAVIKRAYVDQGGWALFPILPMPDVSWYGRVRATVGAIIRFHPVQQADEIFAEAKRDGYTYRPGGARLWANPYTYEWNGEVYEKAGVRWYRVRTRANNQVRFIRVGSAVIERKA